MSLDFGDGDNIVCRDREHSRYEIAEVRGEARKGSPRSYGRGRPRPKSSTCEVEKNLSRSFNVHKDISFRSDETDGSKTANFKGVAFDQ